MKTLVLYATKYGSTRQAAQSIASALGGEDVRELRNGAPSPYGYDEVIIGGPVYIGRLLKPVRAYMSAHTGELMRVRLGLFMCGATPEGTEGYLEKIFPEELRRHACAMCVAGGVLSTEGLKPFDRWIVNMISHDPTIGNFKDISIDDDAIRRFAQKMRI